MSSGILDDSELVIYKTPDGQIQSGGFQINLPRSLEDLQHSSEWFGNKHGGGNHKIPFIFPAGLYVSPSPPTNHQDYHIEVPIFHEELNDDIYDMLYKLVHFVEPRTKNNTRKRTKSHGAP